MTTEVVGPLETALGPAVPLQVEISVQFLAGVAGTILLVLLFLMVVVLWDIALALRDVAEKIDYLEDDVDSDLASINGTLTRIYDRMGGGTVTGNVQGTDVVGGSASAAPGNGEPDGVRRGDVRPGRVRAHAAGVNAAAGGTTTVNPTAGGAFDERSTPGAGRRQVGTAPTAATAGTSATAPEDGVPAATGVGVEAEGETHADAAPDTGTPPEPDTGTPPEGDARTGVEGATDAGDGAGKGDGADDDGTTDDADTEDDGSTADGGSAGSAVEGSATDSEETGPSADATAWNVGRFASDGSGDSAWYDVTMDVPRTARTDVDDATTDSDAAAAGPTVDERLGSDEVRNAYVDPVSAFGNAGDDGEPTVALDDLGSRFQPTSTDAEADETASDAADASGTEPDAAGNDDGETTVDEPEPTTETAGVGAEAVNVDVDSDDDATTATADPGTEVVDVETMPSDAGETSSVDTGEGDVDESEPDGTDEDGGETHGANDEPDEPDDANDEPDEPDDANDEPEEVNVDADEDDADGGDAAPAAAAGEDADAVVADLSAAKARIRERHEDEEGSLDYTSLQQEAAATPGVKGSGMPAEEMLDALAAAAVHDLDDEGDEDAGDVDAVEDALAERREETDDESDAADETETAADDADDGGIADLVNRELDTLTQEVGGTSMTPDVSEKDLDAAVDELDDGSYTFPLSGSSFDVTADADSETATLSFTSTEAMDLGGARERLLTYQLRNYLDRDDTTHAELSVNESAVVLEIPAADGPAVNAWADAIVQIIDRTLYLSKDDD